MSVGGLVIGMALSLIGVFLMSNTAVTFPDLSAGSVGLINNVVLLLSVGAPLLGLIKR